MSRQQLPKSLESSLWSYDIRLIDIGRDKNIIVTQVLNYGSWEDVKWLLKTYRERGIRTVLRNPKRGQWWPRVLNFWIRLLNLKISRKAFERAIIKIQPDFKNQKKIAPGSS